MGFVYIWFDRKHKRFYIGSHWGTVDDGYICSSSWMKKAYKRRPDDFKRRILSWVSEKKYLRETESKWLKLIKKDELKKRYYNATRNAGGEWIDDLNKRQSMAQKISVFRQSNPLTEAQLNQLENLRLRQTGKQHSADHKKKISESVKNSEKYRESLQTRNMNKGKPRSEETKSRIAESQRERWKRKRAE